MHVSNSIPGVIANSKIPELSPQSSSAKPSLNFSEILESLQSMRNSFESPHQATLDGLISSKKSADFAQLLNYQIQVSRYGLKIELSSKLVESVNASIRKLESAAQ